MSVCKDAASLFEQLCDYANAAAQLGQRHDVLPATTAEALRLQAQRASRLAQSLRLARGDTLAMLDVDALTELLRAAQQRLTLIDGLAGANLDVVVREVLVRVERALPRL